MKQQPWLSIIGVGDEGLSSLHPAAEKALRDATVVVGGDRHLSMLANDDQRERLNWPSPLLKGVAEIIKRRGEKIAILASGDPMHFGIGVTFAKRIPAEEMAIFPCSSSFSLAAARLGWSLSTTTQLTLHGRPLELLIPALYHGARIFALSDNGTTPAAVAKLLVDNGFSKSNLTILEHMGGASENQISSIAADWAIAHTADLNTIAIECITDADTVQLPITPGLPDNAFSHDGQLTKREIRAATVSALSPFPGMTLWDVGAGCGSISIEWMRQNPQNKAIAFENRDDRANHISQNARKLGVPGLKLLCGKAPEILSDQPAPDRIFIGGGLTNGVFEHCWSALKTGGVLVANTVTTQGESLAFGLAETYDGELTRLNFSRAVKIGGFTSWKPYRQVTQLRLIKK
jgi:precorrin-6B C5,15-methyltransferase / cobalt-precorrin-6B C5,C15-methyltransferase